MNIKDDELKKFSIGFHAPRIDKSSLSVSTLLASGNPWHVYTGILLSCESGDFSALETLAGLLKKNDVYLLWQAASYLAGFAGRWEFISQLVADMESEIARPGIKYFLSIILGASCSLRAVQPLLRIHSSSDDEDDRFQIENELSYLLEDREGEVRWGATENTVIDNEGDEEILTTINRPKYFAIVDKHLQELLAKTSNMEVPVFEGAIYDVVGTAERLRQRLTDGRVDEGRLLRERLIFEAATGVDCTSFYAEDGTLRRLAAVSVMENFLDSNAITQFVPGQRYFFGHPIAR